MSAESTPPPTSVLARYGPALGGLRWVSLGPGSGFSGAGVWRGEDPGGAAVFALKAWPPGGMIARRLAGIHACMARAGRLPFVPRVLPTADGGTVVTDRGRVWDVCRWMPGAADFRANPTPSRLANACAALAGLHQAWSAENAPAPCPGVARRLAALADARHLLARAVTPRSVPLVLTDPVRRALAAAQRLAPFAEAALRPWADRPLRVQPCLCDVWHDHVLFTGDVVTGLVDFGSAKPDHPAVDLARLLGDLVGDDEPRFAAGLAEYRAAGGNLDAPDQFVRLLDRTGVLCGAVVWLLRLLGEGRVYPAPAAVAARMEHLLARLEPLAHF